MEGGIRPLRGDRVNQRASKHGRRTVPYSVLRELVCNGQRCSEAGSPSEFWVASGSEDRDGGDSSVQLINIGRVGVKSF